MLLLIGILAAIVGGIYAWRSQPEPAPLPAPPPLTGSAAAPTVAVSSPRAPEVTVHVTGRVRRPGVYTLSGGSRVADAVTAAGGPRRGSPTGSVNLARRLIDGEQIVVGAPSGPPATPLTPADPTTAVIDLNTATPDQLEQLPGVGEVLARRITEFRTANGGFRAIEQLRDVSGIGPRKYEELKTRVRV
ncbi:ComEA family DNA-binding protein [Nonomuraea sp. NPDC046570]|uniref:ComEA family DNA-binding protein n=1 Tax=Nonomuraea sp. NPDC046570 TaxID=3155255 RepID=UPI0034104572